MKILVTYDIPREPFKNLPTDWEITFPEGEKLTKEEIIRMLPEPDLPYLAAYVNRLQYPRIGMRAYSGIMYGLTTRNCPTDRRIRPQDPNRKRRDVGCHEKLRVRFERQEIRDHRYGTYRTKCSLQGRSLWYEYPLLQPKNRSSWL